MPQTPLSSSLLRDDAPKYIKFIIWIGNDQSPTLNNVFGHPEQRAPGVVGRLHIPRARGSGSGRVP